MMSLSEQDIRLIEKHLDGNLTPAEKVLVESRIKDKDFLEELRFQKTAITSLAQFHRKQLKEELRNHLRSYNAAKANGSSNRNHIRLHRYYWVAAAVGLTVISLVFFFRGSVSDEQLFASYYKPFPIASADRSEPEVSTSAFQKYAQGDYAGASVELVALMNDQSNTFSLSLLKLLLGNCYLNTDQLDKAEDIFKSVMESRDQIWNQHGKWYYALTLLKNHKVGQARVALRALSDSNSIYSTQAKQLQQQLPID